MAKLTKTNCRTTTASLMTRTITSIKESQCMSIKTQSAGLVTFSRDLSGRKVTPTVALRMTKRATVGRDQTKLTFTSQQQLPMIRSGRLASLQICPKTKTIVCHLRLQIYQFEPEKTQFIKTSRKKRMTKIMIMKTMMGKVQTNSILIDRFSYY